MNTLVKVIAVKSFDDNYGYGFSDALTQHGLTVVRRRQGDVIPPSDVQKYHPKFLASLRANGFVRVEFYKECPTCGAKLDIPVVELDDAGAIKREVTIDTAWVYGHASS